MAVALVESFFSIQKLTGNKLPLLKLKSLSSRKIPDKMYNVSM